MRNPLPQNTPQECDPNDRRSPIILILWVALTTTFTEVPIGAHLMISLGEGIILLVHGDLLALPLVVGEVLLFVHSVVNHPRVRAHRRTREGS